MNTCSELNACDVVKWVKDLFTGTDINIPETIINNSDCLKLISAIMNLNIEAEKDAKEIIKTELELAECYNKKANDLHDSIDSEVSTKDLSSEVVENIKKLASLAVKMKLREPTITSFLLSSSVLENKRTELMHQETYNSFTLTKFSRKYTDIMEKNAILERKIETLEKIVLKQQNFSPDVQAQCKFIRKKAEEYQKTKQKLEKSLENCGFDSSLSHSELVKRSQNIQCLEEKVNNLSSKLESYESLPPNEMLAKLKIEEAQAELLRLQHEFDNLLKFLA